MAARLVWIADAATDPLQLTCAHTTHANDGPTDATQQPLRMNDGWHCQLCDLPIVAQLDQELAREAERQVSWILLDTLPAAVPDGGPVYGKTHRYATPFAPARGLFRGSLTASTLRAAGARPASAAATPQGPVDRALPTCRRPPRPGS